MARHIKVTLEHHLDRRYHTINCGPGRRNSSVTYGGFNLRYRDPQQGGKRVRVPLKTRDLGEAIAERSRKEDELNAAAAVERKSGRRPTLAKMRDKFIARKKMQRHDDGTPLDPETLTAYQRHIGELLDACKVSGHIYPEQLDGDDLRRMIEKLHADDYEHNSICNHYTSVVAFMRFCGLDHKDEDRFLAKGERPRPRVFKPEAYSHAETDAFFAACDNERYALAFEMFLKTGGRELEVAHLPWDDLDLGDAPHVTYTQNTELNHNTKNRKSRSVPLEAGLAAKLREWRKKNPNTKLVFGTEADKVDWHFWRACKRIAAKAGFDPANWWVHKFRDTFATRTLEKRPDLLRTLQSWMGHSSITMTQRYLADAEGQVQQQGINDVFGGMMQRMAGTSRASSVVVLESGAIAVGGIPAS